MIWNGCECICIIFSSYFLPGVDAYSEGRLINASSDVISVPDEQRLYQDLLSVYARTPPPTSQGLRNKVLVNFQLSLHQIVDLVIRRSPFVAAADFLEISSDSRHNSP